MKKAERKGFEVRARVLKALAHPSRLMMIEELSRGERCVCELRDLVGADITTVSKHLSLLNAAGIVDREKRGLRVFYRLSAPCVVDFFSCIEALRKERRRAGAACARR